MRGLFPRTMTRRRVAGAILMFICIVLPAGTANATHYRYGHYTAASPGGNTVNVTIQNAFRRNGYGCVDLATLEPIACSPGDGLPQVGDVFLEFIGGTTFAWGDGNAPVGSPLGALLYVVTATEPTDNWLFALAIDPDSLPALDTTLSHTYAQPGTYTAFTDSCCRISAVDEGNEHINNPDGGYRVELTVTVGSGDDAPVSALTPIRNCPIDGLCSFVVPAADPNGDPVNFRLSTSSEASSFGPFVQPGPPQATNAATIDPITGLYSWDTTGAVLGSAPNNTTLYSTQVTLEHPGGRAALDFMIKLVEEDPNLPVVEAPAASPPVCSTTQVVQAGDQLSFDIAASDPDPIDQVTLNAVGLPLGAVMTPPLPISGNPTSSALSWTPTDDQVGFYVVSFSATSTAGGFVECPVTLQVAEAPDCGPEEDGKVTVCHVPSGNPDNAHVIRVNPNAVPAHLAHGDTCGECAQSVGLAATPQLTVGVLGHRQQLQPAGDAPDARHGRRVRGRGRR